MGRILLESWLIAIGFLLVLLAVLFLTPPGVREWLVFGLVALLSLYSRTFRNWRLRRKLERISRQNMERMKHNGQQ
jgi:hypothetical protein